LSPGTRIWPGGYTKTGEPDGDCWSSATQDRKAVAHGTGTLAGEEDSGRLELIVALRIPRWQIVAVKALAWRLAWRPFSSNAAT
jgi:hypothetical protein